MKHFIPANSSSSAVSKKAAISENELLSPKLISKLNIQINDDRTEVDHYALAELLSKKTTNFPKIKDIIMRTCFGGTSEAHCFMGNAYEQSEKYTQEYMMFIFMEKIKYILKKGSKDQKKDAFFLANLIIGSMPIESYVASCDSLKVQHPLKTDITDEIQKDLDEFRRVVQAYGKDEKQNIENKIRENISTLYTPNIENSLEQELSSFSEQDIWRFYIDGEQQQLDESELGWHGYEFREPNSLKQVNKAQVLALENVNKPLELAFIQELYRTIKDGVSGEFNRNDGYRGGSTYYVTKEFTALGLLEQNETTDIREFSTESYKADKGNKIGLKIKYKNMYPNEIEDKIKSYLRAYEESLLEIEKMDPEKVVFEKLKEITKLICSLDRLHPQFDGNGRLFQNVLLNKELIRNGFSPAIMENPNYLDIFSLQESMLYICQGMANFKYIKQHGLYPGSDKKTNDYIKGIDKKHGGKSAQNHNEILNELKLSWKSLVKLKPEEEIKPGSKLRRK